MKSVQGLALIGLVTAIGCAQSEGAPSSAAPATATATTTAATATMASAPPKATATAVVATASASVAPLPKEEGPPEGMVAVPEGIFMMGGHSVENTPLHEVIIPRFYMDKTEVTVDAYAACVTAGKCKAMLADDTMCNAKFKDRGKHPANCIGWTDANAFCEFVGKRLPTEREWEYSARGGSEQRLYSWGNDDPTTANGCYMHVGGSCVVGSYPAGAFGLFDMTGNVWEWTSSWFAPYPEEAAQGSTKVYRGGSWSRRFAKWMHNDLRNRYTLPEHSASLGMRCAKSISPTMCPKDTEVRGAGCARIGAPPPAPSPSVAGPPRPFGSQTAVAATASGSASPKPEDQAPSRGRAPGFDADCQKHYPGLPVAYNWSGGTFQAREPLIKGAGCRKRDVGVGWSSACCPN